MVCKPCILEAFGMTKMGQNLNYSSMQCLYGHNTGTLHKFLRRIAQFAPPPLRLGLTGDPTISDT